LGANIFISSESAIFDNFTPKNDYYGTEKDRHSSRFRAAWAGDHCGGTQGSPVNSICQGRITLPAGRETSVATLGGGQSFEAVRRRNFRAFVPSSLLKRFGRRLMKSWLDWCVRLLSPVASPSMERLSAWKVGFVPLFNNNAEKPGQKRKRAI